eukprot:c3658_g1_i2 orf=484-2028(-)
MVLQRFVIEAAIQHILMEMFIVVVLILLCFVPSSIARDFQVQVRYQGLDVAHLVREDTAVVSSREQVENHGESAVKWMQGFEDDEGMTIILRAMHRDSPLSPFRPTGSTTEQLWRERLRRDAARAEFLTQQAQAAVGMANGDLKAENRNSSLRHDFNSPVVSGLAQGSGEYFTRFGVGTPARDNFMVLDTGSDISWIQCSPCYACYQQADPIFNPANSSTFRSIPCTSRFCSKIDIHSCQHKTNRCLYQVAYGDGSFTSGDFFLETLSFRGAAVENVALGCGHDNEGLFIGAAGLLGLGGGTLSFPSQTGLQFNKKFSYCLVDRDARGSSSSVIFGNTAVPRGTVFTPLLRNPKLNTFYYVSLVGISVGGSRVSIPASAFKLGESGTGGVIVDSGTSVTRLVETAYGPLRSAFRGATTHLPSAGGFSLFDTCYDLSGKTTVKIPTLELHFAEGANVALPAKNSLVPVDTTGTFCLAFASTAGSLSIIGNIQQQGFRVVFDLSDSKVGFSANQCT